MGSLLGHISDGKMHTVNWETYSQGQQERELIVEIRRASDNRVALSESDSLAHGEIRVIHEVTYLCGIVSGVVKTLNHEM
jgi:hypothetical protein